MNLSQRGTAPLSSSPNEVNSSIAITYIIKFLNLGNHSGEYHRGTRWSSLGIWSKDRLAVREIPQG
jgi:hypothetical protein